MNYCINILNNIRNGGFYKMQRGKRIVAIVTVLVLFAQIFFSSAVAFSVELNNVRDFAANTSSSDAAIPEVKKLVENTYASPPASEASDTSANEKVTAKGDITQAGTIGEGNSKDNGKSTDEDTDNASKKTIGNRIIVKYKDMNKAEKSKRDIIAKKPSVKLALKKSMKHFKMESIEVSNSEDLESTISELRKDSNIDYVQPDYLLNSYMIPQDERFGEQWGLLNNGQTINGRAGTAGVDINAINAWDITSGSDNVIVAVVDTGVDISNSDLSDNKYVNPGEQLDGIDEDSNGFVDDINGWDFVNDDNTVYDSASQDLHGTQVAGLIAAGLNNGGITGVAPNVKLLTAKFIEGSTGYTSDAISAIEYSVNKGASIINCSWGGNEYNQALRDAMENSSALFVCAAGNSGENTDISPVYPACFNLPNIISVTALDNNGNLASFSNYGSNVNIAAPGVDIISTMPGNTYGFMSGTSAAVPFVAGTAALLKSSDSSLTASDIKTRILNNTTAAQNLIGKVSSTGRLNAYQALLSPVPSTSNTPTPVSTPTASTSPSPTPTNTPVSSLKGHEPIYDNSASGNNKIPKPLLSSANSFIDAAINGGFGNSLSINGIENLRIFKLKEKFISVIWTTSVNANTELYYGNTQGVAQSYISDTMTKKHQATIMIDSMDDVLYYKVKSVSGNGAVFETDIRTVLNDITDLGGTAPVIQAESSASGEPMYTEAVSTLGYTYDNNANNSFDTAQQMPLGTVFGTVFANAGSDYYYISLTAGTTYEFDLVGMAEGEDYDIFLYDSTGAFCSSSINTDNYDENIEFTPSASGTFYLKVEPYTISTSSAHHNYQLMAYTNSTPPDSYEPNDDEQTATSMSVGSSVYGTLNTRKDEDWFVVDTAITGKLVVALTSIPADCDYDLEIYKDGTLIDGSYSSIYYDEVIARLINATGKYYIRVYRASGFNANDTYDLKVSVFTPDSYEVNDDIDSVYLNNTPTINVNSSIYATIDNANDEDYYRFVLDTDANVGIWLKNIPDDTDYDVYLYTYTNGDFEQISSSATGGNADELIMSQLTAGTYFVRVTSWSGSSETRKYMLGIKQNPGTVSMTFDKTTAAVDEIITATIRVDNISELAGYQVNLIYDPEVVQPVKDDLSDYGESTVPSGREILLDDDYWPLTMASNDLHNGSLNFGVGYLSVDDYRQNGVAETTGIIGVVKFKVLQNYRIQMKFENPESMPYATDGVSLVNWYGYGIEYGFTVQQPTDANAHLPVNSQAVITSSEQVTTGSSITSDSICKLFGYIKPDFTSSYDVKSGFKVEVYAPGNSSPIGSDETDSDGYFEITGLNAGHYDIVITKGNYLKRTMAEFTILGDTWLGHPHSPVIMWAGDLPIPKKIDDTHSIYVKDNAININDIMFMVLSFNKISGSTGFNEYCDINSDGAINIADIMICC
jgi:subtilisin family serine protease